MDPIKGFFAKYHAIPVTDRNGAARYEQATAAQLADWLRDRDERVREGNAALARARQELIAACRNRVDGMNPRTDAEIEEFSVLVAVLARCGV